MTSTAILLGAQSIEDIHERAIRLWIYAKTKNPKDNPSDGIFFALTDQVWPSDAPEPQNSIELCAVLNQAFGQPPLTDKETKLLNMKAMALFLEYRHGRGPIWFARYVGWANGIGYALAVIALIVSGFSFWVIALAVAVWWCYGAARIAVQLRRVESRSEWEIPVIATLHLVLLAALYFTSIFGLVFR